ncbi:MAG TPA: serine/threonine-protein kinase [Solirubrobacteraceae bacterium]|nr:serine/threonine-protein kinase [Solirubrobacteraceae bacterium]
MDSIETVVAPAHARARARAPSTAEGDVETGLGAAGEGAPERLPTGEAQAPVWQDELLHDQSVLVRDQSIESDGLIEARRVTPAEANAPGALVHDRYRLCERLGAGGFGIVWRAEDQLLRREVALKRIPLAPGCPVPPGRELGLGERAGREALAAARLAHPAIVALYEAYTDDDAVYLISELVHGRTLAQLITARELDDRQILEIGIALTAALGHAHERGVIHRDVKPQNVLIPDAPGEHDTPAKLTDFGGARLSGEDALTRPGETIGTLAYMAPEQSEGRVVGTPADVYSLALVLYEALTGANPVRAATPAATARRIGRQLPALRTCRCDLPAVLADTLDAALRPDPGERATLPQLRSALEQGGAAGQTTSATRVARDLGSASSRLVRQPVEDSVPGAMPFMDANAHARAVLGGVAAPTGDVAARARAVGAPSGGARARAGGDVAPAGAPNPGTAPGEAEPADGRSRLVERLAAPRILWVGCALALIVWQAARGRPGLALVFLALAAPLPLFGRRPGAGPLLAALAPVLGLVGLAGAYPALAGQAQRAPRRAVLGAVGYWWLVLAAPILIAGAHRGRLWLALPSSTPPRATWESNLNATAVHVLAPTLTLGLLLGAALWALGAIVLPWVVRGRNAAVDVVAAVVWSALLFAAAPALDAGLALGSPATLPRGAVLGALLGGLLAIAARALRGPV